MLLLPVPPCNLLSMCVTLLPLSCQVLTRSPQWPWCPRWPRCRLLLLRCPAAGWHQHSPRAQPQGTATVRGWGSCPSGCVGLQVPHGPRGVPSTTPAVGQALLTALFTCRFWHGSSQFLWVDQEALLGLGRLAAPSRAQELLSFAACYSHGDAAEASCTFLPSMSMSPLCCCNPARGSGLDSVPREGRGGKGTPSLGLAPKLEGSPGAGTCLVERA